VSAVLLGLQREDVASLDIPLGTLYLMEPVSFPPICTWGGVAEWLTGFFLRNQMVSTSKCIYKHDDKTEWLDYLENFKLKNDK
jgi:hypothetical protein